MSLGDLFTKSSGHPGQAFVSTNGKDRSCQNERRNNFKRIWLTFLKMTRTLNLNNRMLCFDKCRNRSCFEKRSVFHLDKDVFFKRTEGYFRSNASTMLGKILIFFVCFSFGNGNDKEDESLFFERQLVFCRMKSSELRQFPMSVCFQLARQYGNQVKCILEKANLKFKLN
jgi:hypothetical protein